MGESISAAAYISAGSLILFLVAARIARGIVPPRTMFVWASSWIAATVALFLTGNFYLFSAAMIAITMVARRKLPEGDAIYLYLVLLFVAPTLLIRMPGFAGISGLLELTPQRVLAAAVLLPALPLALRTKPPSRLRIIDAFVVAMVLLVTLLSYRHVDATATDTLRRGISHMADIALPYFIFSRLMTNIADIRKAYFALIVGALPFPVIGVLEVLRTWRMYNPVAESWGAYIIQSYLFRDGMLRAAGPAIEAIAFGFVCMVGMGLMLSFMARGKRNLFSMAIMGAFVVGLIVSLSRGPWMGAAVMVIVYVVARPQAVSNTLRGGLLATLLLIPLFMSPLGDGIVRYLPFVGTVENDNVEYRQDLINNSMAIVARNPFFGSANFLTEPEMLVMRQGQGIIDVVNTYVAFAVEFGLVTLGIFVSIFVLICLSAFRASRRPDALGDVARLWLAVTCGTLLTIATVSSVSFIPYVYWTMAGLGVAICRMPLRQGALQAMGTAPPPAPRDMQILGPGVFARPLSSRELAAASPAKGSA